MNSSTDQPGKKKGSAKGPGKIPKPISSEDIARFISGHMEANKEEIQRAQTELPVIKPTDGGLDYCTQFKDKDWESCSDVLNNIERKRVLKEGW